MDLDKTERRRIANAAKKAKLSALGKPLNPRTIVQKKKKEIAAKKSSTPKLLKVDRKEKYTKLAHDRRDLKNDKKTHGDTICFHCRERGHPAVRCPQNQGTVSICFKCGSDEHRLDNCPKGSARDQFLPFALCFVCGEKGHIAGKCPQNEKGIYVKGGCCKSCGGVDHLETNCPLDAKEKRERKDEMRAVALQGEADVDYMSENDEGVMGGGVGGGDDQPVTEKKDKKEEKKKKRKVVF